MLLDLRTVARPSELPDLARARPLRARGRRPRRGLSGGRRAPRRRHRRPRRPRQVLADRPASPASTPTAGTRRSAAASRSTWATRGARSRAAARSGSSTCPGHERFIGEHAGRRRAGAARAVRGRGRRGVEAADRGAPADPRRARRRAAASSRSRSATWSTTRPLAIATDEVRERLDGHRAGDGADRAGLRARPGDGLEELRGALDAMLDAAPPTGRRARRGCSSTGSSRSREPGPSSRARSPADCLAVGDEVELVPAGPRREDPLAADPQADGGPRLPGEPRRREPRRRRARAARARRRARRTPAPGADHRCFEALLRPVRGLGHAITSRGAYKVYAGRRGGRREAPPLRHEQLEAGDESFARIRASRPARARRRSTGSCSARRGAARPWAAASCSTSRRPRRAGRRCAHLRLHGAALESPPEHRRPARRPNAAPSASTRSPLVDRRAAARHRDAGRLARSPTRPRRRRAAARRSPRERSTRDHPLEEGADLAVAREAAAAALRHAGARRPGSIGRSSTPCSPAWTRRGTVARSASSSGLGAPRRPRGARARSRSGCSPRSAATHEATPPTVKELRRERVPPRRHRRRRASRRGRAVSADLVCHARARSPSRGAIVRGDARTASR